MPSRSACLAAAFCVVAGCGPGAGDPARVAILPDGAAPPPPPRASASAPGFADRLPALGPAAQYLPAQSSVAAGNNEFGASELTTIYTAEAESAIRALWAAHEANTAADFDAVYERIRELFEAQAPEAGRDWARLAFLAGFPEPVRPRAWAGGTGMLEREMAEAAGLRQKIESDQSVFRRQVLALLEDARQRRRSSGTAVAVEAERLRAKAAERSLHESAGLAEGVLTLTGRFTGGLATLPAAPGASVRAAGITTGGGPWPPARRAGWPQRARESRAAALYLALLGRPAGGRDAEDLTEEFRAWSGPPTAGR
jgi:hypothetical protein